MGQIIEDAITHRQIINNTAERDDVDPITLPYVQSVFCIFYIIIFVLGMFGNLLTCFVVCRNRDMQTVTNFFITNLALSDILLCTLSVPFTPLYTFSGKWVFGMVTCHLVAFAQGTSVYVSTLTLTSIAIDRFFVIIYPFRRRMKISTCSSIICCTWLISIIAILPYGVFVEHRPRADIHTTSVEYVCEETWPYPEIRKWYGGVTVTLQFIIPFIIIAVCYIMISNKLSDRTRARPGVPNPRREEADRSRKQRTNRMLIAMVFIFGLCWLPFNCINALNDFSDTMSDWQYYNLCFFIVHVIAMSSTCYNPFLYSWLNENFRKEFILVLPFNSRPRADQSSNGDHTLLTSMSVVRRSSSVRDRRSEKVADTIKVKFTKDADEDRVDLNLAADEADQLRALNQKKSLPDDSLLGEGDRAQLV